MGKFETLDCKFNAFVDGDCMEGKQIMDGGIVTIDMAHMPRVGDPCLCLVQHDIRKEPTWMIKEYMGRNKDAHFICTCYKDPPGRPKDIMKDWMWWALEIRGVVVASYDRDRKLLWERDDFPETLPSESNLRDGNCSLISPQEMKAMGLI
ncbi:MAG: hypothetical protein LUE21_07080 [Oscillospiraceae bacterium]|nr:hypothetical protein [Oscillospiraceae bacterium]